MKQTKRCRADENGPYAGDGQYFPNMAIRGKTVSVEQKPVEPKMRDESLNSWFDSRRDKVGSLSDATGILYVGYGDPNQKNTPWISSSSSTWWVLEHEGKRIGVTVLLALQNEKATNDFHLFVQREYRDVEFVAQFENKEMNFFVEVEPRLDLLLSRTAYLQKVYSKKDDAFVLENLDPEFFLQPTTTLDVFFFNLPSFDISSSFHIASKPPVENSPTCLIAYHAILKDTDIQDLKEEYALTISSPPSPSVLLHNGCSVTLGKITKVGSGIVNVISVTEVQSSGGPYLNDNLEVIGINIGGFYDTPDPFVPTAWTMRNENSNILVDIHLPEKGELQQPTKKNRNQILSVGHSGFQQMLQAWISS